MSIREWLEAERPDKVELREDEYMFFGVFTGIKIWPVGELEFEDVE